MHVYCFRDHSIHLKGINKSLGYNFIDGVRLRIYRVYRYEFVLKYFADDFQQNATSKLLKKRFSVGRNIITSKFSLIPIVQI